MTTDATGAEIVLPGSTSSSEPIILDDPNDPAEKPDLKPADNPEPSPGAGANQDEKTTGAEKRINTLTWEKHEATRKAERLEIENAELKAVKPAESAPVTEVDEPTLPDDLDDRDSMVKYHKDMLAYSKQVAATTVSNTIASSKKTDQDTAHKAEENAVVSAYTKKAIEDGVNVEKLKAGEQMLNDGGVSAQLGTHIMKDPNGGKIVEYLADNKAEMYELLALDPVSAGVRIETVIKQKALANTPNLSNTPDPIPDIIGTGALIKDTFEKEFPNTEFI